MPLVLAGSSGFGRFAPATSVPDLPAWKGFTRHQLIKRLYQKGKQSIACKVPRKDGLEAGSGSGCLSFLGWLKGEGRV